MNRELDLLLKLKELESETNFHFVIDKDNAEIYLFEPNSKEYFDKINIQKELKEAENANPIKQPDSTRVERYTRNVIGRIRGIIQERENRSRAEIARSSEIQAGGGKLKSANRNIQEFSTYGNGSFNIGASLSQRQIQLADETKRLIEKLNKDKVVEAYEKTLSPSLKDLKKEVISSLSKEDSPKNQENQNISSKLFSKFKNKLNNISQNLSNPTNTNSLNDTLEIDKSQDNQESQDSYLKTQYQIKRNRK